MPNIPAQPEWLSAAFKAPLTGVDRDKKIIKGYVLAESGPFKSEGRGEFDKLAIKKIVALANASASGLKSRLSHPGLSSDGIGTFLGRAKNARVETGEREDRDGKKRVVDFVRADLHLDPSAFTSPKGNLGQYVMDLAESDPGAFGSSLVLQADQTYRRDPKTKKPLTDDDGNELPPIWTPTRLHASDVVDEGDAVHGGFLDSHKIDLEALPDAVVRQAWQLLTKQFPDSPREVVRERCLAWLGRYLDHRFGEDRPPETPRLDAYRGKFARMDLTLSDVAR